MRKWQRYTQEFKATASNDLKGCTNIEALARELNVSRRLLYQWRDKQQRSSGSRNVNKPTGLDSPRDCGFEETGG